MKVSDLVYPNSNKTPDPKWEFINYLDTSNLTKNTIFNVKKISKGNYPSRAKRVVSSNDILISTVRPKQCHYGIIKKPIKNMVVSTGFIVLSVKDGVTPEYLYYYLTQKIITDRLSTIAAGATTSYPSVTPDDILNVKINLPDKIIQKKIGSILSTIDNNIFLNNKINTELEQMARMLFDYWFVQFDFPDDEGKPYKTSGGEMEYNEVLKREIPKGWEIKKIGEITPNSTESVNPQNYKNTKFKHYSIPSFDESGSYIIKDGSEIKSNKFIVTNNDILVSKLNPRFKRIIYPNNESNLICSTEFVVWRTQTIPIKNFLYIVAGDASFISYCTKFATGTSNSHKRVNPTDMMNYQIPFSSKLAEKFGLKIDSIIKLMTKNIKQNQELTQLRDFLLPSLMNGQIKVN